MRVLIILFAFWGLSACATVNNSGFSHFRVDSVPQGASVTTTLEIPKDYKQRRMRGKHIPQYYGCAPTPCEIPVPRHATFIATVSHPDYEAADIFISSSTNKGAFAGSMAANTATVGGTVAVSSAYVAAYLAFTTSLTNSFSSILPSLLPNVFQFTPAVAPTAPSVMASAAPPALLVTGSMLAIDAATGANKNLFPNPVVLGLAKKGQPMRVDPLALMFREELALERKADEVCETDRSKACNAAKNTAKNKRKERKTVMKLFDEARKEAAKAAKAEREKAEKEASEN